MEDAEMEREALFTQKMQIKIMIGIAIATYLYFVIFTISLAIYFKKVREKAAFNSNFQLLLYHLTIPAWIAMLIEVFQTTLYFINGFYYEKYLDGISWSCLDICLLSFCNHLLAQIVERVIATVLLAKYEKIGQKFPTIALCIIIGQYVYAVMTLVLLIMMEFYKFARVISSVLEIILSLLLYFKLPSISRRICESYKAQNQYAMKTQRAWSVPLTLRYQSCENLKVAALTARIVLIQVVANIVTFMLHGYGRTLIVDSFEWLLVMKALHWVVYISALAEQIVITVQIGRDRCQNIRPVRTMSTDEERHLYFKQYSALWNT
ncbi:unnamed protein product [Bursaphelenchus xylophilus]|nr:unnamed protein product [Bursaphelenchus xylophilus]CAG9105586.1 unnamed protein product [Bursaphelenchus xylophilus]